MTPSFESIYTNRPSTTHFNCHMFKALKDNGLIEMLAFNLSTATKTLFRQHTLTPKPQRRRRTSATRRSLISRSPPTPEVEDQPSLLRDAGEGLLEEVEGVTVKERVPADPLSAHPRDQSGDGEGGYQQQGAWVTPGGLERIPSEEVLETPPGYATAATAEDFAEDEDEEEELQIQFGFGEEAPILTMRMLESPSISPAVSPTPLQQPPHNPTGIHTHTPTTTPTPTHPNTHPQHSLTSTTSRSTPRRTSSGRDRAPRREPSPLGSSSHGWAPGPSNGTNATSNSGSRSPRSLSPSAPATSNSFTLQRSASLSPTTGRRKSSLGTGTAASTAAHSQDQWQGSSSKSPLLSRRRPKSLNTAATPPLNAGTSPPASTSKGPASAPPSAPSTHRMTSPNFFDFKPVSLLDDDQDQGGAADGTPASGSDDKSPHGALCSFEAQLARERLQASKYFISETDLTDLIESSKVEAMAREWGAAGVISQ